MRFIFAAELLLLARASCLPDAVRHRKNLTNAAGESYPVGFAVGTWSSARLSSAMLEILAEEMLGYNTRVDPSAVSSSREGMYALLGCATWQDAEDRGCSNREVRIHVMADSWWTSFPAVLNAINEQYKAEAPVFGGDMGYVGDAGTYVPKGVLDAGEAEGLALEYYKSYDTRWHQPWKYFDSLTMLNASGAAMACVDSVMADNSTIYTYLQITGDRAGIVVDGNAYRGNCEDGYTWRSPACRSNPERCVMYITGGDGWDLPKGMQRSAVFNMPMVIVVAKSWNKYLELPTKYKALMYWWTPDDSFLDISPQPLIFPPRDPIAQSRGDVTSSIVKTEIAKVVSSDLESMAPDLVQMFESSLLQLEEINAMMQASKADSSASRHDVACQWLRANEDRWRGWIPDATRCGPGYGLYDAAGGRFTSSRSGATECRACQPGTHSEPFSDDDGPTYICSDCGIGTYQDLGASISCTPCPKGEYQDLTGSRECRRCRVGFYQDALGQADCLMCPAGTTTPGLGSLSKGDCGCVEGTINVAEDDTLQCQVCGEGLKCPLASTIQDLVDGDALLGPDFTPQIEEGYAASKNEPLSLHKCMDNCPGGKPGTCAAGLEGRTCAACPGAQVWNGEACADCRPETSVLWLVGALGALAAILCSYYFVNSAQYQKASYAEASVMSFGVVAYTLQNVAVVGMMSVRWTPFFKSTTSSMGIFLFDTKGLSVGCLTGRGNLSEFATKTMIFPVFIVTLLARWALSRVLPFKPWSIFKTLNTMGVILQLGFATMVAVAVKPTMCYRHPNGLSSIVEYPDTLCGGGTHASMLVFGVVLLAFSFGFLAVCAYAAYRMPSWSTSSSIEQVQAFRFLSGKFRLGCWWFGLALLMRTLCFTLSVALFPDAPSVQAAIGSIVLAVYAGCEACLWPWKVPIVNPTDAVVTFALLVLLGHAREGADSEQDFSNGISMALVLLILLALTALLVLNVLALLLARCGRGQRWLNLGANVNPGAASQVLKDCAAALLEMEADHLKEKCESLNAHDLKLITAAISVVGYEVLPVAKFKSFGKRVRSTAMRSEVGSRTLDRRPSLTEEEEKPASSVPQGICEMEKVDLVQTDL